ncbi:hypothetical protein [Paenibacillus sp. 481]|uniref:hypothetical protein n=1 Tax=Paenibacillus sp. 481 TaxID=2835869 RepID=UPI001E496E55|nr:hypothetical protein [Paenibacillus sp. 481]UHA72122.1 hypothetical protein KIK04_15610 [Paenibacillus sp. 481]
MMQSIVENNVTFILSVEELGFALSAKGADDMAAGLLKSFYPDEQMTEQSWELILRTAAHGLIAKGYMERWDELTMQTYFHPELESMLEQITIARSMVRCVHTTDSSERVLTMHLLHTEPERVLYHLATDSLIHVLTWIQPAEMAAHLEPLFEPQFEQSVQSLHTTDHGRLATALSEEAWEQLATAVQTAAQHASTMQAQSAGQDTSQGAGHNTAQHAVQHAVQVKADPLPPQLLLEAADQAVISQFWQDCKEAGYSMSNMSAMSWTDQPYPHLADVLFLVIGTERTWFIYNKEADLTKPPSLWMTTVSQAHWTDRTQQLIAAAMKASTDHAARS